MRASRWVCSLLPQIACARGHPDLHSARSSGCAAACAALTNVRICLRADVCTPEPEQRWYGSGAKDRYSSHEQRGTIRH
jgi:hypothetical protein